MAAPAKPPGDVGTAHDGPVKAISRIDRLASAEPDPGLQFCTPRRIRELRAVRLRNIPGDFVLLLALVSSIVVTPEPVPARSNARSSSGDSDEPSYCDLDELAQRNRVEERGALR